MRPDPSEYAPYYAGYVDLVPETDILPILDAQAREVEAFWRSIPENAASEVHAPYTWSIRQVLDHLVDGERIFGYRLLRISRGDSTPLPGYDDQLYAKASEENPAPLADIIDSFAGLRRANYLLIKNLSPSAWERCGTANQSRVSVRALAYILVGHIRHHDTILRKRMSER